MTATVTPLSPRPTAWQSYRRDWILTLRAEVKSPNTLRLYGGALGKLASWCTEHGGPDTPTEVTRGQLTAFLADRLEQAKPATVSVEFWAVQQLFGWLVREEEIDRSPMDRMRAPAVPEQPVPVLTDGELRALLASMEGKDIVNRRDTAM